jgi:hypothetical protein
MTIVLATVGFTPEKVTEALRYETDVTEVILLAGSNPSPRTDAAVKRIQTVAKALGIRCRAERTTDPYDLVASAIAYSATLTRLKEGAVFNISGGTGVMQSAATLAAFLHGVPLSYYNVDEKRYVRMPAGRLMMPRLSKRQSTMLRALAERPLPPSNWARQTDLAPNLLAYHARQMAAKGFAEKAVLDGRVFWRITVPGQLLLSLTF